MNKEQYNSFDDWFREAAAQPGPAVDDAAWLQMEARLDGEKKKRRRVVFWWWFTGIFLAGGIFMLTGNQFESGRKTAIPEITTNTPRAKNTKGSGQVVPNGIVAPGTGSISADTPADIQLQNASTNPKPSKTGSGTGDNKTALTPTTGNTKQYARAINSLAIGPVGQPEVQNNKKRSDKKTRQQTSAIGMASASVVVADPSKKKDPIKSDIHQESKQIDSTGVENAPVQEIEPGSADSLANDTIQKKPEIKPITSNNSKAGNKPKKTSDRKSHMYLFGAIAPEWSYISHRGVGNAAISYGGGIGYQFSGKWAIQAGVFLSGKKYVAGEGDYTPKPGSYYDNPNYVIESVDADCSVLEIPISVRYTFLQKKRTGFFAMAGISSAIMKEETYDYEYYRYGNPANSSYTYKTGELYLFSGLSISVGMESKLNKNFSLIVAPYFNIPLKGIGEGSVQLNSFGIQGGIKYNLPF
ncbi:PorT family protein [Flavihumibacter fluvii]|uniref:PorT family protein n=1 Tax=Flavihumibacter fluvii TaxID=2838157 RepID=UPI001BDE27BA|nr:PorT family protein [Flavihumibacter fluvii]ULQ53438.1 PorT family protein [Flavihumibacter fluvii]